MHLYKIGQTLVNLHQITHVTIGEIGGAAIAKIFLSGHPEPLPLTGNKEIDNLVARLERISDE